MAEYERFGPYRLERRLGRGGMAEAFAAVRELDEGASPRVCLKRLLPGLAEDDEVRRGLATEARIGATLRHGNIVALLDHGEVLGQPYLVLELVEGADLRRLLAALARSGEAMPWTVVAELAFALAHALDHAHAVDAEGRVRGLLHRDLSPSNVLIGRNGEVKLADFGIAKVVGASHVTRAGILKGKVPYMAPEYVGGRGEDARSDLFALGVTLHECLVGSRPFDGTSDVETLDRILAGRRTPLVDRGLSVPRALVETVDALLAHAPEARPRTGREVVERLADVAPPITARDELALAVRQLVADATRAARVDAPDEDALPEPTWLFSRTDFARTESARPTGEPTPADADAPTRTRLHR